MDRWYVRLFVAACAGFLLSVLVAPWGIALLHWVAYLPLWWALRGDRWDRWVALVYGTVAEGFIFSWIAETIDLFSNLPTAVAIAINALFALVFGLPYFLMFRWTWPLRRRLGAAWTLVLPAWCVVVEFLTAWVILFPYQQGISQFQTPWVWQLASVTGVAGLTYLMVGFNAVFAEVLIYAPRDGRPAPLRWLAAPLGVVACVLGFGAWRYAHVEATLAEAPTVTMLQVQDRATMLERMAGSRAKAFQNWMNRVSDHPPGAADLVVLPEGAVPYDLNDSTATPILWELAETAQADLVVGAGTRQRAPDAAYGEDAVHTFNSVYAFQRERRAVPATILGPGAEAAALRDGCDLDAARVFTAVEARAFAAVLDGGPRVAACVTALRERERALRANDKAPDALFDQIATDPDAWALLRRYTGRFSEPAQADRYLSRGGTRFWKVVEAGCDTGDCRAVMVQCDDADCRTYPEVPHYDKIVPLPFGEYLPFAEYYPWLASQIQGVGNFRAGTEAIVFDAGGVRFGTPICYEGILDHVCDRFEDIDVLVNVTNDAWFGETAASDLHGMLVTARAMELGLPVFRSAYSGTSFVVEPHGAILAKTPLFTEVVRPVTVRLARFDTPYRRFGDWFVALCAGVVVVGLGMARRRTPT